MYGDMTHFSYLDAGHSKSVGCFSINELGETEARRLACEARRIWEEENHVSSARVKEDDLLYVPTVLPISPPVKPFVCVICGVRFGRKGAISKHMKLKHTPLL